MNRTFLFLKMNRFNMRIFRFVPIGGSVYFLFITGYIDEGFHVPAGCRIWISDIASSDQCRHHGAHLNFRALTLSFNHKIIFCLNC